MFFLRTMVFVFKLVLYIFSTILVYIYRHFIHSTPGHARSKCMFRLMDGWRSVMSCMLLPYRPTVLGGKYNHYVSCSQAADNVGLNGRSLGLYSNVFAGASEAILKW